MDIQTKNAVARILESNLSDESACKAIDNLDGETVMEVAEGSGGGLLYITRSGCPAHLTIQRQRVSLCGVPLGCRVKGTDSLGNLFNDAASVVGWLDMLERMFC